MEHYFLNEHYLLNENKSDFIQKLNRELLFLRSWHT